MSAPITIWQINDCEFYIGAGTAEEIMAAYTADTGVTAEDNEGMPVALDDEALDSLRFHDADENEQLTGTSRTFREQLAIEIAEGGEFPRLFAATDY
jgi:hypothetical protein